MTTVQIHTLILQFTKMTEEELRLHNALLDVQFCGNEKEVLLIQGYHAASDRSGWLHGENVT